MKIPKNKNKYPSLILCDCVGEYIIPGSEHIHIKKIWDNFDIEEALQLEHETTDSQYIKNIQDRVFYAWLVKQEQYHEIANFDRESTSNYYMINFYLEPETIEADLTNYLNSLITHILDKWRNRGADDDYFDYLPSLTDMFYQLCEYFDAMDIWKSFLDQLLIIEPDVTDDSLYRY